MKWIILSYLIINPLFFLTGTTQRTAQAMCFQILAMLIFACSFFFDNRKIKRDPLNIALACTIPIFLISWLIVMNGWENIGSNIIYSALLYVAVIKTIKKDEIKFILRGVAVIIIFSFIVLGLQYLGYDLRGVHNISDTNRVDTTSIFWQRSAMGLYFMQGILLLLPLTPFFLLLSPAILASESMGAILGFIIGLLFFLWYRKRIFFWIALIPLILGIAFFSCTTENYKSIDSRLPLWKVIIPDIFNYPLGHGLDSFANPILPNHARYFETNDCTRVIKLFRNPNNPNNWVSSDSKDYDYMKDGLNWMSNPHNEYIWLGYDVGFQSLILLGVIIYFIWMRFKRSRKDIIIVSLMAYLVSVAVCSTTQFYFHLARIAHIFPIMLGLFYVSTLEED